MLFEKQKVDWQKPVNRTSRTIGMMILLHQQQQQFIVSANLIGALASEGTSEHTQLVRKQQTSLMTKIISLIASILLSHFKTLHDNSDKHCFNCSSHLLCYPAQHRDFSPPLETLHNYSLSFAQNNSPDTKIFCWDMSQQHLCS